MRPFHFRYQRLMALARQERQQAALALARALEVEGEAQALLDETSATQAAARRCHDGLRRGTRGWLLAASHVYRADLARQTRAAAQALAEARQAVEVGRRHYRQRHQQEEVYRRLRRRAWEQFQQEDLRRQQRLADEAYRWRGNNRQE